MFLKQKTAYEMRISDWSSDVCSSSIFSSFSSMVPPPTSDSLRSVPPSLFFISLFPTAGCQSGSALKLPITAQTAFADTGSSAVERSEESRVGKEWLSRCRYRGEPFDTKTANDKGTEEINN